MPELPEVETVCRGLDRALVGRRLTDIDVRRADLRRRVPADFASRLKGRKVVAVRRVAKYILADLDDGMVLIAHLGMSGRMFIQPAPGPPNRHDHVIFRTDDGGEIRFNDARRFGLLTLARRAGIERHPLFRGLGLEPLDPGFTPVTLSAALANKATPIKSALLDQRVVVGIGNIYASEALHRAGISPKRLAKTVAGARAARLAPAIRQVLGEAIAAGGSTLRDYVQASGELGYFQGQFRVYGLAGEKCRGCGRPIKRIVQAGRSTFYCGHCQK
jgi:formamidopyrimidine-DNA glycosylase